MVKLSFPFVFAMSFLSLQAYFEYKVVKCTESFTKATNAESFTDLLISLKTWFAISLLVMVRKNGKNIHSISLGLPIALVGIILYFVTISRNGCAMCFYGEFWKESDRVSVVGPGNMEHPMEKAALLITAGFYCALEPSTELTIVTITWILLNFARIMI